VIRFLVQAGQLSAAVTYEGDGTPYPDFLDDLQNRCVNLFRCAYDHLESDEGEEADSGEGVDGG
jgi:hypothetical protein